ncbi:BON domain-containing protein [Hydrocarboniphaga sp.]|uniref:BON domain-containing protein n=1 Tax=Hydrocarboniphaga sp. TaxID=2033016 RepID=UPI003D127048
MNTSTSLFKKSLMIAGIAATLGVAACNRNDGQMTDGAAADAPKESASIGAAMDDTAITAKVKQRLASDERMETAKIDVETNNGVVTLTGSAPSGDAKKAAEELARNVAEVQGIDNKIAAPGAMDDLSAKAENAADKAGTEISDATITTKVKAQFAADDMVKATAINVDTDNGVVTLKGEVASAAAQKRAIDITKKIDGVKSVDDDELKISQS